MNDYIFLEGTKKAVILFHAYTGSPNDVRMLGTYLNNAGYTVLMPLFFGHGTNDMRNILDTNAKSWIEQSKTCVNFLKSKGYCQMTIFGLSMGGIIAFNLLMENDNNIIGGGSFNSPIPLIDDTNVKNMFMWLIQQQKINDMNMQQIDYQLTKQLKDIKNISENIAEHFNQIDKDIYIAQSGCDELIDSSIGQTMKNHLVFANVDFHYFEKAKHVITVGQYRKEFNQTVLNFLNQLNWGRNADYK